ncbi:Uncharacterised protein [Dermatophilus congolensis]|uniref:Uncharacterized protein n=1 Tax=Dermatophilus congolensis TaxID=1863 RepID=A0A239VF82_9MICO|nr:Uncharacterised protein [Dermatophilus congolensis]
MGVPLFFPYGQNKGTPMFGRLSVEAVVEVFRSRRAAAANYGVPGGGCVFLQRWGSPVF